MFYKQYHGWENTLKAPWSIWNKVILTEGYILTAHKNSLPTKTAISHLYLNTWRYFVNRIDNVTNLFIRSKVIVLNTIRSTCHELMRFLLTVPLLFFHSVLICEYYLVDNPFSVLWNLILVHSIVWTGLLPSCFLLEEYCNLYKFLFCKINISCYSRKKLPISMCAIRGKFLNYYDQ